MMMNKKKNKSKKRKVQLTWELMSKLLELIESTKRGGGVRWVRLFILVKFSRSSECDKQLQGTVGKVSNVHKDIVKIESQGVEQGVEGKQGAYIIENKEGIRQVARCQLVNGVNMVWPPHKVLSMKRQTKCELMEDKTLQRGENGHTKNNQPLYSSSKCYKKVQTQSNKP